MTENENFDKNVPILFEVENAGLALLSPWLPLLFSMLGYLNESRKDLKDDESRIRAIFLLQYIVYGEEREYRETELVFNRLLVGLPQHIPIPKQLALTDEEKQTADNLLNNIKFSWPKISNISMRAFQYNFIYRIGRLEQQEEKWMLTMEEKTHDILLKTIPWNFRQISLPWLKEYLQVMWHEK